MCLLKIFLNLMSSRNYFVKFAFASEGSITDKEETARLHVEQNEARRARRCCWLLSEVRQWNSM